MILYYDKHAVELAFQDYEDDDLITVGKVREIINNLYTVGFYEEGDEDAPECSICGYYDLDNDTCIAFECFGLGCPKLPCEEGGDDGSV